MKPLILITNDDGVFSPGLIAVAEAVEHLGELLIVAPRFQQTSMGRSFPKGDNIGIIEKVKVMVNGKAIDAYGVHGSPAQAVAHGILELAPKKPDLCVSGINYGENLGLSVTCSGTIGAAFEAYSYDVPSVAVSREAHLSIQHSSDYQEMNWEVSKEVTADIVSEVLKNGLPKKVSILNVNVPDESTNSTEIRITKQSNLNYGVFVKPEIRDFDKGYRLKSKFNVDINKTEKNSDMYAFYSDKVITVTPLTWDLSINADWKL